LAVDIRMMWCLPLVISSADGDPWHADKPAPDARCGT
jgi:hypothetical protein